MIQLNLFGWSEPKRGIGRRKPYLGGELIVDHYERTAYAHNELLDKQTEHIFPYPLYDVVDYEAALAELERRRMHRLTMKRKYQIVGFWTDEKSS